MSYGAVIQNSGGRTIIDDSFPTYASVGSIHTLTWHFRYDWGMFHYEMLQPKTGDPLAFPNNNPDNPNLRLWPGQYHNGSYWVNVPADYDVQRDDYLAFYHVPIGHRIILASYYNYASNFRGILSSFQYPRVRVLKRRDLMAPPSGHGMAIFNASGQCMWDDKIILGYVAGGKSDLTRNEYITHEAGDVWVSTPSVKSSWVINSNFDQEYLAIYRHNSTTLQLRSYRFEAGGGGIAGKYIPPVQMPILLGRFG